jgi:hypothetical protein
MVKVAIVSEVLNDTQVKHSNSVLWTQLRQGDQLYLNDAIRTTEDSAASIKFDDGSLVSVEENSMIIVKKFDRKISIDFISGDLLSQVGSDQLQINVNGSVLALNSGETHINKTDGEDTKITVHSGEATLGDVTIDSSKRTSIGSDGQIGRIEKLPILLISPKSNFRKYIRTKITSETFTWSLQKGVTSPVLEISTSRDFKSIKRSLLSNENSNSSQLPPGKFFWRIRAIKNKKKIYSEINFFQIFTKTPFFLVFPSPNSMHRYINTKPTLKFKWTSPDYIDQNVLEISRTGNFDENSYRIDTKNLSSHVIKTLGAGSYQWRIRGATIDRKIFHSKPSTFEVSQNSNPDSPALRFPSQSLIRKTNEKDFNKITFSWTPVPEVSQYIFEISPNIAFSPMIYSVKTAKSSFSWNGKTMNSLKKKLSSYDKLYWRVHSVNFEGLPVKEKEIRTIMLVSGREISLIEPIDEEKFEYIKALKPVKFSWREEPAVGKYVILFSAKPDFSKLIQKLEVSKNSLTRKKIKPGKYYWKVTLRDKNKKTIKESPVRSFNIIKRAPPLSPPQIVLPAPNTVIKYLKKSDLEVKIKWSKVKKATSYKLHVTGKTEDGDDFELKKHVRNLSKTVKFPAIGTYKFYLIAMRKKEPGSPSKERRLAISTKALLSPPKILKPVFH